MFIYSAGKSNKKEAPPISFEQFIKYISDLADDFMINEEKKTGNRFVGGKCEIAFDEQSNDVIISKVDIYSMDENKKWKISTLTTRRNVSRFTDDVETKKKLQELHEEPLKFDVKVPEKGDKN